MRVISTPVTAPRPANRRLRSLDLELLGLLGSAAILTLGVLLSLAGKIGRLPDIAASDAIVSLHALTGPADLEPVLPMFDPPERQVVARALYHRVSGAEPRLEHVGGLASVTLPASEIRANRRLVQLTARLARRPDASTV